jgi:hypothetical protein
MGTKSAVLGYRPRGDAAAADGWEKGGLADQLEVAAQGMQEISG